MINSIKFGKSFIKEHLQEGYKVYGQNWDPWNGEQLQDLVHQVVLGQYSHSC